MVLKQLQGCRSERGSRARVASTTAVPVEVSLLRGPGASAPQGRESVRHYIIQGSRLPLLDTLAGDGLDSALGDASALPCAPTSSYLD